MDKTDKPESGPGKLLGISGSYWQTCTLHAAVKLDVFTAIGNDKMTYREAAGKLSLDPRAVGMLLNALCAMALLEKVEGAYINTSESKKFLSKDSPGYIGYMIMHHHNLVESWSRLDESVASGRPVRTRSSFDDEEYRESFLMGMFNIAMGIAPQVAKIIDLSGRKHLLDLGGGPGTYAIHFCKHNPELKATVFDLPTTRPFAQKTIARFGMDDNITFFDGNYINDSIIGTFDVAWLSHILHAENQDDCERIIQKTVLSLKPGGMIIIHDFILENTKDGPLFPALFSLNMLLGTSGGRSYSEQELVAMLAGAGAEQIHRSSFCGPTDSGIITGILP
ncbi:MAG: methyltransferase [Deltaproteobacteria bacterium]|nr:methyltransferase [Deltaproteobacteria bacterium]